LNVYRDAFAASCDTFELTQGFPREEMYSLTDQIRKSSRSVCSNIAEAWRKRRYPAAFISKLSDAEAEAAETQVWLEFAVKHKYAERGRAAALYRRYDAILAVLVGMITHPDSWVLPAPVVPKLKPR
jgi:four helix bundle protein